MDDAVPGRAYGHAQMLPKQIILILQAPVTSSNSQQGALPGQLPNCVEGLASSAIVLMLSPEDGLEVR